jgi:predicted P-loop ATPase
VLRADTVSALDLAMCVTTFPNEFATSKRSRFLTLRQLSQNILDATAPTKEQLEFLKLASFGARRSGKGRLGCLRSDRNLIEVYGGEADYDGEQLTPEQLADALRRHGLAGVIYTSPTHRDDAPRARILVPFSTPLKPERRAQMISRIAGIIPAPLAPESWNASQSYYFGRAGDAPQHRVLLVEGDYVDLRNDLDRSAKPKPPAAPRKKPKQSATAKAKRLAPDSKHDTRPLPNDAPPNAPDDDDEGDANVRRPLDIDAALSALRNGGGAHSALVSLAGKFAEQGMPQATAVAILVHAIEARLAEARDDGWYKLRGDVQRTVTWAYEQHAEAEAHYAAVLTSARSRSGNSALPPHQAAAATTPTPNEATAEPSAASPANGGRNPPGTMLLPNATTGPSGAAQPARQNLGLLRNRKPKYMGNVENVLTILRQNAVLAGSFAFDQMALVVVVRQPLPWQSQLAVPYPITDDDVTRLQAHLQRHADMAQLGRNTTYQAIEAAARENAFHPVRDHLNNLVWDGTKRLDYWLHTYAGTIDNSYTRAVGRMFLVGMVARVYRPGCKMDYVLVLEGDQGIQKSELLAELGGPWFSDYLPPISHGNKDLFQHLRGRWLIEMAELAAMARTDPAALNAFITRRTEEYRPPYARTEVLEPRQCVLAGTTNALVYIYDPTGSRRFWPVRAGQAHEIELKLLRGDRNQLLAEACHTYRDSAHWWPEAKFEKDTIKPQQQLRESGDAWEEPIGNYLAQPSMGGRVTVMDIAERALGLEVKARLTPRDQHRITAILQRFNWGPRRSSQARWWEKLP